MYQRIKRLKQAISISPIIIGQQLTMRSAAVTCRARRRPPFSIQFICFPMIQKAEEFVSMTRNLVKSLQFYCADDFCGNSTIQSKRFRKSSSQKNYAFLSYDVYMTYITSRDISRESREATDQSERLNKYGSHRCFLPGRIGRKRLCRRLSFFGPRTLTVTLPKPLCLQH